MSLKDKLAKLRFQVIATGEVGQFVPCAVLNPVILRFANGYRDVYRLSELVSTTDPMTPLTRHWGFSKYRRTGVQPRTRKKFEKIIKFLNTQSQPLPLSKINKALGFNCSRHINKNAAHAAGGLLSLEGLGIVERVPRTHTWVAWQLTEVGRQRGAAILEKQVDTLKERRSLHEINS